MHQILIYLGIVIYFGRIVQLYYLYYLKFSMNNLFNTSFDALLHFIQKYTVYYTILIKILINLLSTT